MQEQIDLAEIIVQSSWVNITFSNFVPMNTNLKLNWNCKFLTDNFSNRYEYFWNVLISKKFVQKTDCRFYSNLLISFFRNFSREKETITNSRFSCPALDFNIVQLQQDRKKNRQTEKQTERQKEKTQKSFRLKLTTSNTQYQDKKKNLVQFFFFIKILWNEKKIEKQNRSFFSRHLT